MWGAEQGPQAAAIPLMPFGQRRPRCRFRSMLREYCQYDLGQGKACLPIPTDESNFGNAGCPEVSKQLTVDYECVGTAYSPPPPSPPYPPPAPPGMVWGSFANPRVVPSMPFTGPIQASAAGACAAACVAGLPSCRSHLCSYRVLLAGRPPACFGVPFCCEPAECCSLRRPWSRLGRSSLQTGPPPIAIIIK